MSPTAELTEGLTPATMAGMSPRIQSYESARQFLEGARSKEAGRPVANNTRVFERMAPDGTLSYAIRLHNTDVVTYLPGGQIILNSGGWPTVTTQDRISSFSPARVGIQQRYTDTGARAKTPWGELDKSWAVHSADPVSVTPAKIQRCRVCSGTGVKVDITEAGYVIDPDNEGTGDYWSHARWITFQTPERRESTCHRCNGTGERDYGSVKVYPDFFDGIVVDSEGNVIEPAKAAA